jgi:squalene-hopene/tetraprenyl-beta-curcumene cyclase
MKKAVWIGALLALRVLAADLPPANWSPAAAARFLDMRESWWAAWPHAARDRATFCVSCHTAIPYALARPELRGMLGAPAPADAERQLRENVAKRVRLWNEVQPYYPGQDRQSRGTEAVGNAIVLAGMDAARERLNDDSRAALAIMWTLQETSGPSKGAWPWINFVNEPWEGVDSPFYGACLAALAAGIAPENYQADPKIQVQIGMLREYLVAQYPKQSLLNQAFLLWASAKLHGLLTLQQQRAIANDLAGAQRDDGGWSSSSIAWSLRAAGFSAMTKVWRSDASPLNSHSDGLATGVVVIALDQSGWSRDEAHVARGLAWLSSHQTAEGAWRAESLNKHRDQSSGIGLFMTDAATAFVALALATAR